MHANWWLASVIGSGLLALAPRASTEPARPPCTSPAVADRLDVLELMSRYSWALDSGVDRGMLAKVFATDAVADYVSSAGESVFLNEHLRGFEAIYRWLRDNQLRPYGAVDRVVPHHFLTSPLAEIHGDDADLRFVLHGWPGNFVGIYRIQAVRTSEGWRIAHLRLESMIEEAMTSPRETVED